MPSNGRWDLIRRLKVNGHCFDVAMDIGNVACDVVQGVNWSVSYEQLFANTLFNLAYFAAAVMYVEYITLLRVRQLAHFEEICRDHCVSRWQTAHFGSFDGGAVAVTAPLLVFRNRGWGISTSDGSDTCVKCKTGRLFVVGCDGCR